MCRSVSCELVCVEVYHVSELMLVCVEVYHVS